MAIIYDYYRIFYFVAKYGSFTNAAKALLNSQSNITRSIKNLENELGCKLFIRSHKGVKLTPEGEHLFMHVSIAYRHLQLAEEELKQDKSLESGVISIGVSETALHVFLLPKLEEYNKIYPKVKIHIYNHSTPQAIRALKDGLIDFAVITTPFECKPPLKSTPISSFEDVLVGGPRFKFLKDTELAFEDLSSYPLIGLGKSTATYGFYRDLYISKNLIYNPDIEVATSDQILPMVMHNLGIAFMPKIFADAILKNELIYQLNLVDSIPVRNVCIIKNLDYPLNIASLKFVKMLSSKSIIE